MGGSEGASNTENSSPKNTLDQKAVDEFASSAASSGVDVSVLRSAGPAYMNSQGQDNGYSAAIAAFNTWQATKKNSDASRAQYLLDASQAQGQDATKLVNPDGTQISTLLNFQTTPNTLLTKTGPGRQK